MVQSNFINTKTNKFNIKPVRNTISLVQLNLKFAIRLK